MLKVTHLLVGHPIWDRTKVMTWIKRDTLVLQVGGWGLGMGLVSPPPKTLLSCNLKQIKLGNYLDKDKVNK